MTGTTVVLITSEVRNGKNSNKIYSVNKKVYIIYIEIYKTIFGIEGLQKTVYIG